MPDVYDEIAKPHPAPSRLERFTQVMRAHEVEERGARTPTAIQGIRATGTEQHALRNRVAELRYRGFSIREIAAILDYGRSRIGAICKKLEH